MYAHIYTHRMSVQRCSSGYFEKVDALKRPDGTILVDFKISKRSKNCIGKVAFSAHI